MSRGRVVVALLVLATVGPCFALTACSREVDIDDFWKTLPQPNDVGLNGSIQQIAVELGKLVELPAG